METTTYNTLIDLQKHFSDETVCRKHLEKLRWNGKIVCPFCKGEKIWAFKDGKRYKCGNKECLKKFTVTVGTIFENSKIPLSKWFIGIYLATSHKKGIASTQIHRDLGLTQKTGWFMLSRIRKMLEEKSPNLLQGTVEIDETYVGGKDKFKKKSQREKMKKGTGYVNKTMVFSMLERDRGVYSQVMEETKGEALKPIIRESVERDSTVITDGFGAYKGLNQEFHHEVVNHSGGEYVRGGYHTNTIEGFFSLLKRSILGVYHSVSPKHLERYCVESGFRYNTRKMSESGRFDLSLTQCEKRLRYRELIAK